LAKADGIWVSIKSEAIGCSHKKEDCPSNPFFAIVAVMKLKDLKDLKLGAMHVATHRRQGKGREYVSHFLRRSYREDGKVKKETLPPIIHRLGSV
jgi:hypothetical protein